MILLENRRFMCYCNQKESSESFKMSTVGHAAFAVCKVRENREKTIQRMQNIDEKKPFNIDHQMAYTPMKYNSKLMNSIWGMYNRYSVHNLKKIMDDGEIVAVGQQGTVGNTATNLDRGSASTKTATKPPGNLMQNWFSPTDYSY
ncbi:uncharacterized protein [Onthophagus taurus]|uniref:uncharacterized protein n=1 Tax=Onthophagus taurus TaxID=166361 RepID=UPI000C1FF04C|nr:uncharacterized protein LOC111426148 [Onthophagus taurus]